MATFRTAPWSPPFDHPDDPRSEMILATTSTTAEESVATSTWGRVKVEFRQSGGRPVAAKRRVAEKPYRSAPAGASLAPNSAGARSP